MNICSNLYFKEISKENLNLKIRILKSHREREILNISRTYHEKVKKCFSILQSNKIFFLKLLVLIKKFEKIITDADFQKCSGRMGKNWKEIFLEQIIFKKSKILSNSKGYLKKLKLFFKIHLKLNLTIVKLKTNIKNFQKIIFQIIFNQILDVSRDFLLKTRGMKDQIIFSRYNEVVKRYFLGFRENFLYRVKIMTGKSSISLEKLKTRKTERSIIMNTKFLKQKNIGEKIPKIDLRLIKLFKRKKEKILGLINLLGKNLKLLFIKILTNLYQFKQIKKKIFNIFEIFNTKLNRISKTKKFLKFCKNYKTKKKNLSLDFSKIEKSNKNISLLTSKKKKFNLIFKSKKKKFRFKKVLFCEIYSIHSWNNFNVSLLRLTEVDVEKKLLFKKIYSKECAENYERNRDKQKTIKKILKFKFCTKKKVLVFARIALKFFKQNKFFKQKINQTKSAKELLWEKLFEIKSMEFDFKDLSKK